MESDGNTSGASASAGNGIVAPNSALSQFMTDLLNRTYFGAPGSAPRTGLAAGQAGALTAPSNVALDQASVLAAAAAGGLSLDFGKLSESDQAAFMSVLMADMKSTPLAGEAFGCAGCEFFTSLQ